MVKASQRGVFSIFNNTRNYPTKGPGVKTNALSWPNEGVGPIPTTRAHRGPSPRRSSVHFVTHKKRLHVQMHMKASI